MSSMNHTSIEYVSMEKIPLDLECQYDFLSGNGIRLTSVESLIRKIKRSSMDCSQSSLVLISLLIGHLKKDIAANVVSI